MCSSNTQVINNLLLYFSDLKEFNVPEWGGVHRRLCNRFPHILRPMDLILTMAPSSAQAEPGFSQLKVVKTNIRANLGQTSLNNSLAVKFLSKDISQYDPSDAIQYWNDSALLQRRPNTRDQSQTKTKITEIVANKNEQVTTEHDHDDVNM